MDRLSKQFVIASVLVALAIQLWLLNGTLPGLWWQGLVVMLAAAAAGWRDRRAVALVLLFAYTFPVIVRLLLGRYHIYYSVIWSGALFAAMLPTMRTTGWNLPGRWRLALVTWALVIVAASVVTIARESDFYLGLWFHEGNAGPIFSASWILHIALGFLIGILWFDWICGAGDLDRVLWIASPLAASCAVLAGVAIYQSLVDIGFFNDTLYGVLGRASGTVFDGNVCAAIAAFWVAGAALLGDRLGRFAYAATIAGMAFAWMAVWATASRTGFGAAAVATAFVAVSLWRRSGRRFLTWRNVAVTAVVAAAALFVVATRLNDAGPIQRLAAMLPDLSRDSFAALASELWNRNRYGDIATRLLAAHPWFGLGIGGFNLSASEYALSRFQLVLVPDNAQNWYRHQLVEFGSVGSVAWIAWVLAFGWFVIRRGADEPPVRSAIRGALIGFGLVSLVGMPGQDVSVAMTFWTFAALYVVLAPPTPSPGALPRAWVGAMLLVAVFTAGTLQIARTALRPPFRARDNGIGYGYGFNAIEPDGRGGVRQWARRRAVAVVPATGSPMRLTVSVNHTDLSVRPVHAQVWVDGRRVIDSRLATPEEIVATVPLGPGHTWVAVDTLVDRTVRPSDLGVTGDARELGLLVGWSFGPP